MLGHDGVLLSPLSKPSNSKHQKTKRAYIYVLCLNKGGRFGGVLPLWLSGRMHVSMPTVTSLNCGRSFRIIFAVQVPCLRELNLADNMLGDDGVEGLAAGLPGHPCLESLVLDGNDVGLDGTQSLCEALLQNASLRTLALRRNSLLADSAEVRGDFFFSLFFISCRLHTSYGLKLFSPPAFYCTDA